MDRNISIPKVFMAEYVAHRGYERYEDISIFWYVGDTKFLFECCSTRGEKFRISKRLCNVLFIISTPMKYKTISVRHFFLSKGAIYYVAIATVIFSHVTCYSHMWRSCFRVKAHLVFHWCLYNKKKYFYRLWPCCCCFFYARARMAKETAKGPK